MILLFLFLVSPVFAAYCGTSTIPYSLEVLPDGTFQLGCARPTCFGWNGMTGNWATLDQAFVMHEGKEDGFLRTTDPTMRATFDEEDPTVNPQSTVCFPGASCEYDQWASGLFTSPDGTSTSLVCCSYSPLKHSISRGVATIGYGQMFTGGEVYANENNQSEVTHFDYIRNIQKMESVDGQVIGYKADVARMRCREPPPPMPPTRRRAPCSYSSGGCGSYYYPVQEQSWWCFAADSMVLANNGTMKRMEDLTLNDWVQVPTDDLLMTTMKPVYSWLHRMPEEMAEFVVISTTNGKQIKLTPGHFIYATDCENNEVPNLLSAIDIQIGDCLYTEADKFMYLAQVKNVTRTVQKGIYAPLTRNGKIVVDGVAASCYSEISDNTIVQTLHKTFVHCDSNSVTCALGRTGISFAVEMARLVLPISH